MASPVVATQDEGLLLSGTAHTVAFPSGAAAGDLILVMFTTGAVQATMSASDGFIKTQINPASGNHNFAAFYKRIDGSEGGDVVITTGGSTRSAWTIHRITGAADPSVTPPDFATLATGTTATPNPGSASVTGGPKDVLAVASFRQNGEVADDDSQVNTGPSTYTFSTTGAGHQKSTGTGGAASTNCLVATAYKELTNVSSEDPGTFGVDSAVLNWQATTVLIHEAPPAGAATDPGWMGGGWW